MSSDGVVQNERGRVLTQVDSRRGSYVALWRSNIQFNRMTSRLVAEAFVPRPDYGFFKATFDTPINLDGDRMNNSASNLMWRPRWFAIKYHRQFSQKWNQGSHILDVSTDQIYNNVLEVAMSFGLLAVEVFVEACNHGVYGPGDRGVWPTGQHFVAIK